MSKLILTLSSVRGTLSLPPSKSHSIRSLLFAHKASGPSTVHGLLSSPDTEAMLRAIQALGSQVERRGESLLIQKGKEKFESQEIDCGNSGQILRNFSTSGAISLTASSSGTSGACYGISMASGQTMSTTGGGTLSLNGTGGASDTASYGINLADWTISTATGSGNVSLTGTGRGTAVSHGVFLDSTGTISTGTGDIAITGSTTASGVGSFPVFLEMDLVTEGGSVSVQGATLLAVSPLIDTTNGGAAATGGNITFSNNVEGSSSNAQSLTLRGGTAGNILLSGSIGNSVALQNLIFTSGDDITVSSTVNATGITQTAGAGLTLFSDNVTLTGAASLTGTQFTLNGTWITGGAITIVNSGLLTMGTSSDFQLSGAFAQTGAGAVNLGGDVTTTNDAIGFAGPVTLTAGIDLDTQGAAGITFENTVTGAFSLSCTAGSATFEGVVGSTPLTSLVVTADAISVYASQSVSTGALTYTGPVTLFGNATFTKTGSGAVTFSEGIEGNFNAAIEATLATVSIADAELSDMLPPLPMDIPKFTRFKRKKN